MTMLKLSPALIAFLFCTQSFAKDANSITPNDLPGKAIRAFTATGRGEMPEFPLNFGVEDALKNTAAEKECMAPVGKQITDWETQKLIRGFYWTYTISAEFECLPPVLSTTLAKSQATNLVKSLKSLKGKTIDKTLHKDAEILCYTFNKDECKGGISTAYLTHNVCEIKNLNSNQSIVIEDIDNGGDVIQNHGAIKLAEELPVFIDTRRDDNPRGNCQPTDFGQFKGIARQSAKVACSTTNGIDSCQIDGIINFLNK